MRTFTQFLKFSGMALFCGMWLLACSSDEPVAEPEPPSDTLTVEDLDDLSDHLQFLGATKKEGKTPAAPGSSSLKFSIKDTLHLVEGVLMPIKFLHDELTNVAGAYIQIHGFIGGSAGTFATHYYDVPEVLNTADSDTVSIIMVGFDPADFEFPLSFDITIAPYDEGGQLIDETEVPVEIEDLDDPNNSDSGSCPLVNAEGEIWSWYNTFFQATGLLFTNSNGYGGQYITGCCTNGRSAYDANCATENERSLYFRSGYVKNYESLIFKDNGTYTRVTREIYANPEPNDSDFCNGDEGVVESETVIQGSEGNWSIANIPSPFFYATRDYLTLQKTSGTSVGLHKGGFIHQLDCDVNSLVLLVPDPIQEGSRSFVFHFYQRIQLLDRGEEEWYPFI